MSAPPTATTTALRIVSFLPAATEMVYALGLGRNLVGRTHECDSPEEAKDKPVIVDCVLNLVGYRRGLRRRGGRQATRALKQPF
jgi:ABC-type hemin transport system substrate-binding protein